MKPTKTLNNQLTTPVKRTKKYSPELDPHNNLVTKTVVLQVANLYNIAPEQVVGGSSFICSEARKIVYYVLHKRAYSYNAIAKLMDQRSNIQHIHSSVTTLIQKYEIDKVNDSMYLKIQEIIKFMQSFSSEQQVVISNQSSVVS